MQEAPAFGQARSLTAQLCVLIDPVEEVATRLEEIDLVGRDESPTFVHIALYSLDDVSIPAAIRMNRQVAADQPNVGQAKLMRPGWKQPRCRGLLRGDADKGECIQASGGEGARRAAGMFTIGCLE
jgi:hypothetical protein